MSLVSGVLRGAAAGAAGTTALNAVTYLDMVARGRPTSSTPEDTVEKLSDKTGVPIPGDEDTRSNRVAGLGPLTGLVAGVGTGTALGVGRSLGWCPGPVAARQEHRPAYGDRDRHLRPRGRRRLLAARPAADHLTSPACGATQPRPKCQAPAADAQS